MGEFEYPYLEKSGIDNYNGERHWYFHILSRSANPPDALLLEEESPASDRITTLSLDILKLKQIGVYRTEVLDNETVRHIFESIPGPPSSFLHMTEVYEYTVNCPH